MKKHQFIKVVGTSVTGVDGGRLETTTAKGIVHLKRGQGIFDFICAFLVQRGISGFDLNERFDGTWATSPMMFLDQDPKQVLTFTFKEFTRDDLGFQAKDLSTMELSRDMKQLKRYV